jgi:hypothetical protein
MTISMGEDSQCGKRPALKVGTAARKKAAR